MTAATGDAPISAAEIPEAPGGIRGFLAIVRGKAGDTLVEALVREARMDTARQIAKAIRESAPEGHKACTSWPHCTDCGKASQAARDAEIAFRAGAAG